MRLLPRTIRGTWLLAGAAWLMLCCAAWSVLPGRPRAAIPVDDILAWFRLSPDGRYCAVSTHPRNSDEGTLRVWDARTGSPVVTMPPLGCGRQRQFGLVFSPNGRECLVTEHVPASSGHAAYQLWDVPTGSLRQVWRTEREKWDHPTFAPDGDLLAVTVTCEEGGPQVRLLELPSFRTRAELSGAQVPLAFSPDGRWIVTASDARLYQTTIDGQLLVEARERTDLRCTRLSVWETATARIVARFESDDHPYQCRFSSDGRWLALGSAIPVKCNSRDLTHVWDVRTGHEVMSVDGRLLQVTGKDDLRLVVWEYDRIVAHEAEGRFTTRFSNRFSLLGGPRRAWDIPAGRSNVVGIPGNDISFLDTLDEWLRARGMTLWNQPPQPDPPRRVIDLIDFDSGQRIGTIPFDENSYQFSADGRTFANYRSWKSLDIWDVPPRPWLSWFLTAATLLALPLAWLARRHASCQDHRRKSCVE